jgi:TetR/AcrR family transcriptional repressor of nem operon
LIAETLAHALKADKGAGDLADIIERYLSPKHRDDLAGGCSTGGLGAETIRQAPAARAAMTTGLRETIGRLTPKVAGETEAARRRAAIGHWSAMVGALVLARLSDDLKLSDEILSEARHWLEQRDKSAGRPRSRSGGKK